MRIRQIEWILLMVLVLVAFGFSMFGIFYPDEGYILHTASRLLDGEVMYRDFQFVYTPLSAWIPAFFFILFGQSVFIGRISAVFITSLTVFALFLLSRQFTKNVWIRILLPLLYLSWGPAHINFVWPSMVAISSGIWACYFFLTKNGWKKYVLTGVFTGLSILSKQNIGLLVVVCFFILSLLFQDKKMKRNLSGGLLFLGGLVAVSIIFFLILLSQGSVIPFWENFYLNVVQKIVVEGTINTPFLYGNGLYAWTKLLFYLSPPLLSFPAVYLSLRKKSLLLILPVFCISIYVAGIRPVTDYVHVSPLMALAGFPLLPLLIFLKEKRIRFMLLVYAFAVMSIGFYNPLFQYYYRWSEPVIHQTYFLGGKGGIFVDKKTATEIPEFVSELDSVSENHSYLFINYYAPMLYFLLDRRNPTKYDYLSGNALSEVEQRDIVRSLDEKHVMHATTHDIVKGDTSPAFLYIQTHFVKEKKLHDLTLWRRK